MKRGETSNFTQRGNMKKTTLLTVACLMLAGLVAAPTFAQQANDDKEAVRLAVLDYVEGVYNVSRNASNAAFTPS
jgi:starvation-inducible outer membrane lipoprotein